MRPIDGSVTPDNVLAVLGQSDLNIRNEDRSINSTIWDISFHYDWQHNERKYDADIAVVILMDEIEFTNNIKPICLHERNDDEFHAEGMLVGWPKAQGKQFPPKQIQLVVNGNNNCEELFASFTKDGSQRTFCAGFEQSELVGRCFGTSSGGLYQLNLNSHWQLVGIVSLAAEKTSACDASRNSIFTNVAKYSKWIDEVLKISFDIVWSTTKYICRRIVT